MMFHLCVATTINPFFISQCTQSKSMIFRCCECFFYYYYYFVVNLMRINIFFIVIGQAYRWMKIEQWMEICYVLWSYGFMRCCILRCNIFIIIFSTCVVYWKVNVFVFTIYTPEPIFLKNVSYFSLVGF